MERFGSKYIHGADQQRWEEYLNIVLQYYNMFYSSESKINHQRNYSSGSKKVSGKKATQVQSNWSKLLTQYFTMMLLDKKK